MSQHGSGPPLPFRIGVVVVNYASSDLLVRNLGAIRLPVGEIVVVDNWSSLAERERLRAVAAEYQWRLVELSDNRGFGAGVNAGVQAARELGCDCFLLLNPDVEVSAAVIDELRVQVEGAPDALVSPLLVDPDGVPNFSGSVLDLRDGRLRSVARANADPDPRSRPILWLTAACLVVHGRLWDRVGGFEERFFMYWEDVDFNYRCRNAGARTQVRDDLVAVHDQGGTQGQRRGRGKSSLYYYYNCRNRMVFAVLHLDQRGVVRWLIRTPRVSYETWLRGGRRQILESPRGAAAALHGAAAAVLVGLRHLVKG